MDLEYLDWYDVYSSNVARIAYDGDNMALFVEFNNGYIYEYDEVPPDVWDQFIAAPSKGKFVHTNLKNIYPYFRLN